MGKSLPNKSVGALQLEATPSPRILQRPVTANCDSCIQQMDGQCLCICQHDGLSARVMMAIGALG